MGARPLSHAPPLLDRILRLVSGYAVTPVGPTEYVGTATVEVEELEQRLERAGCYRNPLASLKRLEDGRRSRGSWMYRERRGESVVELSGRLTDVSPPGYFARRQLHLVVVPNEYNGADLYAHAEFNPWRHPVRLYRIDEFEPARGSRRTRSGFESSETTPGSRATSTRI